MEIESGADCLADLAQRFQFPDRSRQFAGPRFEFFEQPHVLDRDHRLGGEGFEQLDLFVGERANFGATDHDPPDRNTFANQWRTKLYVNQHQCMLSRIRKFCIRLCRDVMNMNCFPIDDCTSGSESLGVIGFSATPCHGIVPSCAAR